jgi:hypothetical protein
MDCEWIQNRSMIEREPLGCRCVESTYTMILVSFRSEYVINCQLCTFAMSLSLNIMLTSSLPLNHCFRRDLLSIQDPLAYLSNTGHTKIKGLSSKIQWCRS